MCKIIRSKKSGITDLQDLNGILIEGVSVVDDEEIKLRLLIGRIREILFKIRQSRKQATETKDAVESLLGQLLAELDLHQQIWKKEEEKNDVR